MAINSTVSPPPPPVPSPAHTPRSIFFTTRVLCVTTNAAGGVVVSRRHAAEDPWYSAARRNGRPPPSRSRARARAHAFIVRKTMQLFRANVDSGGLSIRTPCRGTRFRGSMRPCRPRTRLSSLHFAPSLIHSRSIIPKAETHRVYLRDALIYPGRVSSTLGFCIALLSFARPVRVTRWGSRGINYFCN